MHVHAYVMYVSMQYVLMNAYKSGTLGMHRNNCEIREYMYVYIHTSWHVCVRMQGHPMPTPSSVHEFVMHVCKYVCMFIFIYKYICTVSV